MQRRLRFQWILPDHDPDYDRPNLAAWAEAVAHRFVRRLWLSVLMVLDHPPLYRDYRRRFGVSMDTFRRDKRKVRLKVWYVYAVLNGQYRTCIYIESISHE
ncbi:MAG TPA: hypothetical protein VGU66_17445 [Candidatus Elarobacter sp.]|nr:hypothetical protein [Candidatus Elarobacter sp.]